MTMIHEKNGNLMTATQRIKLGIDDQHATFNFMVEHATGRSNGYDLLCSTIVPYVVEDSGRKGEDITFIWQATAALIRAPDVQEKYR